MPLSAVLTNVLTAPLPLQIASASTAMPVTAHVLNPLATRPSVGLTAAVALSLLLAACTSVPMPVWMPGATGAGGSTPVAGSSPSPSTSTPGVATAPVSPAQPPAAQVQPPAAQPIPAPLPEAAPYSQAVAARFPAPAVVYSTPGLQPGRNQFSSQPEIRAWLRDQATAAARNPGMKAAVISIGRSQRGEELEALVLTRSAGTDPASLLAIGKPTVLLIGQQHGDEPAGSEALLVIARELAQGLLRPLLDNSHVLIVPRANPDGGEAIARATTGGLDMNRDHLLLNTPEAQALARLARDYRPAVVVDAHEYTAVGRFLEKFGTVQKFDALLQYATTANLPEFLTKAAEEWYRRPLLTALKAQGLSSEWYYTTSPDTADRRVSMGGTQPDTARNVYGLKNAVSVLIETRGIGLGRLHLQRRVHTHVTAITSVLSSTAQRASELSQLRPYIDKEVAGMACTAEAVVEAGTTPAQYDLQMLDPNTGADKVISVDWDSALALRKLKVRTRPCGYVLSEASAMAVERLRMHGVQVQRVAESGGVLGDRYQEVSRSAAARQDVRGAIADAQPITLVQVRLARGLVDVARGSYYVSLNQTLGNLVHAALEPDTQNSYFANALLPELGAAVRVMAPPSFRLEELP